MRRSNTVLRYLTRARRPLTTCAVALVLLVAPHAVVAKQKNARTHEAVRASEPSRSRDAPRKTLAAFAPVIPPTPSSPLIIVVSIAQQKVHVYDVNGEITSSRVSTGRPGFDTPTGVFSLLEKNVYHESNIYSGASMPYQQRITWSGVALHAGVVPGFRASHGCIRLPYSFAKKLFGLTKVGGRVIVTKDTVEPVAFQSAKLFKPLPLDDASAMNSEASKSRVAVNDRTNDPASSDALQDFPRLIGVSPALARAVADMPRDPDRRPTTRTEAEQMVKEKIARLQGAVKTAEAARAAAGARSKNSGDDFDGIAGRYQAAQRAIAPFRAGVSDAEKRQQMALRAYEDFMSSGSVSADKEAVLEDDVLNSTIDADRARVAAAKNEMSFAEAQAGFTAAKAGRDAVVTAIQRADDDLKAAQAALTAANKEFVRRGKPVSVLVSLRAKRIYVRQGIEPILDVPITVAPLQGKVGTHVFTAMRYGSDPNTLEWRLVSAQTPPPGQPFDDEPRKKKRNRDQPWGQGQSLSLRMANAALDAFTIPDDIAATITELAKPGSSLIVSDRELPPNENGNGTEFVLLTR